MGECRKRVRRAAWVGGLLAGGLTREQLVQGLLALVVANAAQAGVAAWSEGEVRWGERRVRW